LVLLSPSETEPKEGEGEESDEVTVLDETGSTKGVKDGTVTPLPGGRGFASRPRGTLYAINGSQFKDWSVQVILGNTFQSPSFTMKVYSAFLDRLKTSEFQPHLVVLERASIHAYGLTAEAPHAELSGRQAAPARNGHFSLSSVPPMPHSVGLSTEDGPGLSYSPEEYRRQQLDYLRAHLQAQVHPSQVENILQLIRDNPPPEPRRTLDRLATGAEVAALPEEVGELVSRSTENTQLVQKVSSHLAAAKERLMATPTVVQRAKFVNREGLTEIANEWFSQVAEIGSHLKRVQLSLVDPASLQAVLRDLVALLNASREEKSFACLMLAVSETSFSPVQHLLLQTIEPFRVSFGIGESPKEGWKIGGI
jgi:hypothetical protein